MRDPFWNRTPFLLIDEPMPDCFKQLEERLAGYCEPLRSEEYERAEQVCWRMANVEFYAAAIRNELNAANIHEAAIRVQSYLVSYFSACKSLLDAGSITLNVVYDLELSGPQQDFGRKDFWSQLAEKEASAYKRYEPLRPTFASIKKWRDATIHRVPAVSIPSGPGPPDEVEMDDMSILVPREPDVTIRKLVLEGVPSDMWGPLSLHEKWKPELVELCVRLCDDIGRWAQRRYESP